VRTAGDEARATSRILVVNVESTTGWGAAARSLVDALRRAGAEADLVGTGPVPQLPTFALTDLSQAWLARRTCERALRQREAAVVIYCAVTAALLWPRPGAIWLDSLAAENRPGRHGVWQRLVERRRLRQAPFVLTMSGRALDPLGERRPPSVVVPVQITPSAPADPSTKRDIDVLAYAGNPEKKRLQFILSEFSRARRGQERLVVAGIDRLPDRPAGVELAGRLAPDAYRALLRRARVFAAAPLREDFGIAPLEALADGCMLVTTPAPGPYPALDLARELDARLVGEDLGAALRIALDQPLDDYAAGARRLLAPFAPAAVAETLAQRVLPVLLPGWRPAS
jgi:Glycosyl transferases group 1